MADYHNQSVGDLPKRPALLRNARVQYLVVAYLVQRESRHPPTIYGVSVVVVKHSRLWSTCLRRMRPSTSSTSKDRGPFLLTMASASQVAPLELRAQTASPTFKDLSRASLSCPAFCICFLWITCDETSGFSRSRCNRSRLPISSSAGVTR